MVIFFRELSKHFSKSGRGAFLWCFLIKALKNNFSSIQYPVLAMSVPNLAIVKVPPSSQAHLVPETKSLQVATTSSLPNLQIVLRNAGKK